MKTLVLLQDYSGLKAGDEVDVKDEDVESLIADGIAKAKVEVTQHAEEKEGDEQVDDTDSVAKLVYEKLKTELKTEGTKLFATARDHDKEATGPYKNFGEFAKAVAAPNQKFANWNQERIEKISGMSEGISADGGFLIPPEWSNALIEAINEESQIAPRCRNFAVNRGMQLPYLNRGALATSSTGGMRVYKPAEGVAKTTSYPVLAKADLRLYKMAIVVYATDELIADSSIALQSFLTTLSASEFALTKDDDIINGSGAGECLGVLNAPATVSQAKQATQATGCATIVTENIINMYSRLYPRSIGNAVWLANPDCLPQLTTLTIDVGTGGAPVGILQPLSTGGISSELNFALLGRPLILSPACITCGTVGDIILADFSQYITITKAGAGIETATSIHLKFLEDETAFRFVIRFDGEPWWAQAITPKRSALTQSPFITLATR